MRVLMNCYFISHANLNFSYLVKVLFRYHFLLDVHVVILDLKKSMRQISICGKIRQYLCKLVLTRWEIWKVIFFYTTTGGNQSHEYTNITQSMLN